MTRFSRPGRQIGPRVRRRQQEERGLSRRPRRWRRPARRSCTSCAAKSGGRAWRSCWADAEIHVCDVEFEDQIARLRDELAGRGHKFAGLLHSIAFADYADGMKPFHETPKRAFLRAMDISCYSLIAVSNALKDLLEPDASVVTISISTTRMASENYGYMAPIKAALDSSLAFLAKSFSRFSQVRFNAVAPGLLKTSASAGIPGYVDSYLYAEQVIPRKEAVETQEAANVAVFLLSPRSSGINAQSIVVDAGMSINYFDADVVRRFMAGGDARQGEVRRGDGCGLTSDRCQSTASMRQLIPLPMPSRATCSLLADEAVFDGQGQRDRQCDGAGVAEPGKRRVVALGRQAQRFEHQPAVRAADLVADRLVDLVARPAAGGQKVAERRDAGGQPFVPAAARSRSA